MSRSAERVADLLNAEEAPAPFVPRVVTYRVLWPDCEGVQDATGVQVSSMDEYGFVKVVVSRRAHEFHVVDVHVNAFMDVQDVPPAKYRIGADFRGIFL